jgi:hypothetical protein
LADAGLDVPVKPQSSLTDGSKSNRRAKSLGGKSHRNPIAFGAETPRSPPAEAGSANPAFLVAHLLCDAQQMSESQILDAGRFASRWLSASSTDYVYCVFLSEVAWHEA